MSIAYHKANQDDEPEIWNKVTEGTQVKETQTKAMEVIMSKAKKYFSAKNMKKKLPILSWLPKYNTEDLLGDFIAGLTVGLTVIPQGIAYALIAGLPPNYGLYSAFFGSFLYVFFGSCKDITIGPTAIMSILTYEYTGGDPELAILLCFTSGIMILCFGIFNLGFLINFVSNPVITGFTSAAAITIATSQVKGLLGIKFKSHGVVDTWIEVFRHIGETRWQDFTLGVLSIIVLLLLKKIRELPQFKKNEDDGPYQKAYKMAIFLISVGRNALVVIIATIISASLDYDQPFIITGEIQPGLPAFQPPLFTLHNGTMTFIEAMQEAGSGVIILPLIAVLENIAIGSAFSQGKTIDATQEMIALGICNLGGSFVQAMPTTGSFSRTAVNANSGVRTTAGGIVTGSLIVLALAVLTPYFRFIPLSALSAVIICAVIFMIEYHEIKPIWRARKSDQLVLWTSFLICIFWKLEYGIVLGALLNLGIMLIVEANPKISTVRYIEEESACPTHIVVTPCTGLLYVNIEKIRANIMKAGIVTGMGSVPVILDCCHFSGIDYSAAKGIEALCKDFGVRNQPIFFMNAVPKIQKALRAIYPKIKFIDSAALADILLGLQTIGKTEEFSASIYEEKSLITEAENLESVKTT